MRKCIVILLVTIAAGLFISGFAMAKNKDISDNGAYYDYINYDINVIGNQFKLHKKVKLTVINARGEDYANIWMAENKYSKLNNVSIKVYDGDGKEILKKKKRDMTRHSGYGGYAVYADNCYYEYDVDVPGFPYTIEYEYTKKYNSLFFLRGEGFQKNIPVNHFEYNITASSYFSFCDKVYRSDIRKNSFPAGADKMTHSWVIDNVPALSDEDYIPPGLKIGGQIAIFPAGFELDGYPFSGTDWKSIGRWYKELAQDKYLDMPAASPPQTTSDKLPIAKEIYDGVIGTIRYVAIEIGIGGWQPYSALQTEQNRYGDCKDMATLLISRLRNNGIEAYPVLVKTRGAGRIDTNFPTFGFNHAIAVAIIGSDTIWMDPTSNLCPFGELPTADSDIDVMVVTDEGGAVWHTPPSAPGVNSTSRKTYFKIDQKANASFETNISVTGVYAQWLRGRLNSNTADETRILVNGLLPGGEKKYKVNFYDFQNLEDLYQPLEIVIKGRTVKPIDKIGKKIYCPSLPLCRLYGLEKVDLSEREYPVNLYYPDLDVDSVFITWDESIAVDSIVLPKSDSLTYGFVRMKMDSERRQDTVVVSFTKAYNSYMINPEEFEQFDIFTNKLKTVYDGYVKLISK